MAVWIEPPIKQGTRVLILNLSEQRLIPEPQVYQSYEEVNQGSTYHWEDGSIYHIEDTHIIVCVNDDGSYGKAYIIRKNQIWNLIEGKL